MSIIALLAFASGAKVAVARTVEIPEVCQAESLRRISTFPLIEPIVQLHSLARNRHDVLCRVTHCCELHWGYRVNVRQLARCSVDLSSRLREHYFCFSIQLGSCSRYQVDRNG